MSILGVDGDRLAAHLRTQGVPLAGPLELELVSGGKSNLTVLVTDGASRWVLRRPPLGSYHPGAHDVLREHRVMAALEGSAVPVPRMVAACADVGVLGAPYYLMERVDGEVLRRREQVEPLSEDQRRRLGHALVDTLADLHDVDVAAVGLDGLGRPDGFLARQLDRWRRQYHSVSTRHTTVVDDVADQLTATLPAGSAPSIVHGDYRLDNAIVASDEPTRIVAVLDWEMATVGDPLADLGMLVMFWDEPGRTFNPISGGLTAFAGFPSADEVVQRYAERRSLPARATDALPWYLAFSRLKLAVILEQIHVRRTAGLTPDEDDFDGIDQMVDQLLDEVRSTAVPTR